MQALHVPCPAPVTDQIVEHHRTGAIKLAEETAIPELAFGVVVTGRTFAQEPIALCRRVLNRPHPLGFSLGGRFYRPCLSLHGHPDDIGYMTDLLVKTVRVVGRCRFLRAAEMEAVGETVAVETV